MMGNLTYCKPNGEWGIEGVDLSTLPPKVYGALCKLRDLEHKTNLPVDTVRPHHKGEPQTINNKK